jgi:riboflavin kinase / FMN adenylyltransferase
MNVWETDLTFTPFLGEDLTVCLGYFDGVHLGHQQLILHALSLSKNVAILTFDRNPKSNRVPETLTPLRYKTQLLKAFGMNHFIVIRFDDHVLKTSPLQFMEFLKGIGTKRVVCGPDFRFGHLAQGTVDDLKSFPFTTHIIDHLKEDNQKISTSTIIHLLQAGHIPSANKLLGRYYEVTGHVGRGLGKGKELGYPTANIILDEPFLLPKNGVYIVGITIDEQSYYALASLGYHPTVANLSSPSLEVHVLNYQGNLYEHYVKVQFLDYIREERKFTSLDGLIAQMHADKAYALSKRSQFPEY